MSRVSLVPMGWMWCPGGAGLGSPWLLQCHPAEFLGLSTPFGTLRNSEAVHYKGAWPGVTPPSRCGSTPRAALSAVPAPPAPPAATPAALPHTSWGRSRRNCCHWVGPAPGEWAGLREGGAN